MGDYKTNVIDPGDRFSEGAFAVCKGSFQNSSALRIIQPSNHGFRGSRGWNWINDVYHDMMDRGTYETGQSDGAGGKLQFHALLNTPEVFAGAVCEPLTMCIDDDAAGGGMPVMVLSSNIDVKGITNENWHLCDGVLQGLEAELKKQRLVLLTGETAIMKHNITAFCDLSLKEQLIMTWSMTTIGLASSRIAPNGSTIKPGMPIVGFKCQDGYRCNGGTALTEIVLGKWGPDIRDIQKNDEAIAFVRRLVTPSRSYARTISRLRGWEEDGTLGQPLANIAGVAHITGGGVWSKLADILPEGVGANLPHIPTLDLLQQAQRFSFEIGKGMSDWECFSTLNGGCDMMTVCATESDAQLVMAQAEMDGHEPFEIGETTASPDNEILITSRFMEGGVLSSLKPPE